MSHHGDMPETKIPDEKKTVEAALVIIGDEILSGRTRDANLNYLAVWLGEVGIRLSEVRVVADDKDAIVRAVRDCKARYEYVFTTGGIGPTHDDITAQCIAAAFNVPLEVNPDAQRILKNFHAAEGHVNKARMRMARVPEGASLIENPVSAAPGFQIENVFVLAGIPVVMQAMLEKLRDRLEGGEKVMSKSLTVQAGESTIAEALTSLQNCHPALSLGSYPFFRMNKGGKGKVGTCLVFRGVDEGEIDAAIVEMKDALEKLAVEFEDGEPALVHQKVRHKEST